MDEALNELKEKAIEVILSFKPQDRFDKKASDEILRLKGDIRKTLILLPEKEREVLELRYFENLNYDQISERLGKDKKEIYETILRGADLIKTNIQNVQKPISQPSINKPTQQVKPKTQSSNNIPPPPSPQALFILGIITLSLFGGAIFGVFYIFQKFVLPSIPYVTQAFVSTADIVLDKASGVNTGPLKNKINSLIKSDNTATVNKEVRLIKISGSSSLLSLSIKLKENFILEYPKYKFKLLQSDSEQGLNALLNEEVDIANSSRPITFSDQNRASKRGLELIESRIAIDALVLVANSKNKINELSLSDLQQIFNGQILNWSNLPGGNNIDIQPVVREHGSGTNEFVINRILEGSDFPETISRKANNEEIVKFISENEGAIGFVNSTSFPHENKNIKYLKIRSYEGALSFSPFIGDKLNEKAMRYGDYPLAHYLYFVSTSNIKEEAKTFLDWVLSFKGQEVVRQSGLIPVEGE